MLVLPSKELLDEVLQVNVSEVYIRKNEIRFRTYVDTIDGWTRSSDVHLSNIYELAHKCKEWASNNQFTLVSGDSGHGFVCSVGHYSNNDINAEFYGKNEFSAVIQACEWILKEINNATSRPRPIPM